MSNSICITLWDAVRPCPRETKIPISTLSIMSKGSGSQVQFSGANKMISLQKMFDIRFLIKPRGSCSLLPLVSVVVMVVLAGLGGWGVGVSRYFITEPGRLRMRSVTGSEIWFPLSTGDVPSRQKGKYAGQPCCTRQTPPPQKKNKQSGFN